MAAGDTRALVAAYWQHYVTTYVLADAVAGERWSWAWDEVDDLVSGDFARALRLVVDLAEACHSARALAYLGAGPVEDLVKLADGSQLAQIIEQARRSDRFRRALATIWISDEQQVRALKSFFDEYPPTLPDGVLDDARGP